MHSILKVALAICLVIAAVVGFKMVFGPILGRNGELAQVQTTTSVGCVNITHTLQVGSTDVTAEGQVSLLQRFLKERGFYTNIISGIFGEYTKAGVISFEKQYGQTPDGIVGATTAAKIKELSCTSSTTPTITSFKLYNADTDVGN